MKLLTALHLPGSTVDTQFLISKSPELLHKVPRNCCTVILHLVCSCCFLELLKSLPLLEEHVFIFKYQVQPKYIFLMKSILCP